MTSSIKRDISVVIPAYNESARLDQALQVVTSFLERRHFDWELIVVDDGSNDMTRAIARRWTARNPRIKLIEHQSNRGKGAAVKTGVLAATKDIVVFTDADQATPIDATLDLLAAMEHAAIAIGSRYVKGARLTQRQPFTRRLLSRAGNLAIRVLLGLPFHDTQCGFKVMTRTAAQATFSRLTIDRWGFDIELLVIARAHQLAVAEVPVTWNDGTDSKLQTGRAAWSTLKELWQIRQNVQAGRYV